MKKIKKDLVSKKKPIEVRKVENKKQEKVQDLAPKAKNLTDNIKKESEGQVKTRKLGETKRLPINPRLSKAKSKK